jgi:hypothetical protein
MLIALALMFFADLWSLSKADADNIHIICPLIIAFAITALWELNRNIRYLNVLLGAWLIAAPFVLGFPGSLPKLSVALAGLAVALLSLLPRRVKGKYGGGWKSLFQSAPPHDEEVAEG